jgi:hypothetical protein
MVWWLPKRHQREDNMEKIIENIMEMTDDLDICRLTKLKEEIEFILLMRKGGRSNKKIN